MAAAAKGESYKIEYGGSAQYDFAPDVGRAFALAARAAADGAHVANFPGVPSTMQEVVDAIEAAAPAVAGKVFWEEGQLPFPRRCRASSSSASSARSSTRRWWTASAARSSTSAAPERSEARGCCPSP